MISLLSQHAFLGHTLQTLGEVLIALTVLAVHFRVWKEHQIDERVFREMRHEQTMGVLGIILIVGGYILQIPGL